MTFQDVKVFAGDKFLPAADVAYNNLTWDITATLSEASSTSDGPGGIQSTSTPREGSSTSEGPGGIQSTATTSVDSDENYFVQKLKTRRSRYVLTLTLECMIQ